MTKQRTSKAAAWQRWYKKNREKVLRRSRVYRQKHRAKRARQWKRWYTKRIADPLYREKKQKRNAVWYRRNRAAVLQRRRDDRKRNPSKYARWERARRLRDPKAHAEKKARYYMKHKKTIDKKNRMWRDENKSRHRAQQFVYRAKNKKALLAWRVKKFYGLTLTEYLAILSRPCGICRGKAKHLDHCHRSGVARGGLCNTCNLGLGMFKDDPKILKRAIKYLTRKRG